MTSRKRRAPAASATVPLETWYVESSALLAAFLEADAGAKHAIRAKGRHITSGLTLAEAHRAVLRAPCCARGCPAA